MFAQVTARESGRHMASRALWLLGSTGVQGAAVAAVVAASLMVRPPADATIERILPPVLIQPPKPAPRPPSLPGRQQARTHPATPASALIQPVDVPPVASTDPGPPEPVAAGAGPADGEWMPGTEPTGVGGGDEEDVLHVQAGFRAPAMATRGCVQQSVRVPRELAGFVSGQVVVKFAVGRDGAPSRFSVVGDVPERLSGAIWQAVQGCRWVAGADASGQPVSIWVVMPLRFAAD